MAFDSFSVDGQQYSIPPEISELFQKNYEQILVDPYLSPGDVVLLAIHIIETKNKKSGAEYDELKKLFVYLGREENIFQLTILKTKSSGFLKPEGKKIYLLPHGLTKLKKLRQVHKSKVFIINAGEHLTAIRSFEEYLKKKVNNEDVLLCDSYIDHTTLYLFSELKGKIKSLKILTEKISCDLNIFENYKKKLGKELNAVVEVKIIKKKIHDRYILFGNNCWVVGHSIKDLGSRDTDIIDISERSEYVSRKRCKFMERWNEALNLQTFPA